MAYALVTSNFWQSTNGNGASGIASIDSTGANFLVATIADADGTSTLSDSKSNLGWTKRTTYGTAPRISIWYCANPTVGTAHTFTVTATGKYPTLSVASFSGGATVAPYDVENGATLSNASLISTGSITPTADNMLVIAGLARDGAASASSINGGFTIAQDHGIVGGQAYGGSMAYLIQTTAAAANPQWSWTGGSTGGADIASFKEGAAATKGPPARRSPHRFLRRAA